MNILDASWNFTLDNYGSVWAVSVQLGLILLFLLFGNCFRKFEFVKKAFIPSALIGGLLLLIFDTVLESLTGYKLVDQSVMQVVTYHALAIGFIAVTLKNSRKKKMDIGNVIQNGALTGGTYMLQAVLGLAISLIFFAFNSGVFYDMGMLLPLGYGQGPGNALTWDINFSELVDEAGTSLFSGNGSVGLTIASVGFIVASVFGVIYINIFKAKGEIPERQNVGQRQVTDFEVEGEIGDSDSVDKLSIQFALVALVYALSFGFMCLMSFSDFTKSLAWGFNFIWGVIFAIVFKNIYTALRNKKIIRHQYVNNYQMDRISGFAFDLMIVAGVAAIDIGDVQKYIWPIVIMCAIGAIATYAYVRVMTKKCFKGYEHEMFVCNFGTLTGTASNGMILLREIDPNFETPTSGLYIASQLPAMIMVAPILLFINFSSKSLTNCLICFGIFAVLFIAYTILMIVIANKKKSKIKN